ncbi:hypothetical protein GCK32_009221 [Trichostrongylus colubriformis]|uniref:Choline O-acetyltransferase n=1 Tax=Trichostrongylus colubriformis TaxID=6319 RepID=A0AAN8F6V0_TRICO
MRRAFSQIPGAPGKLFHQSLQHSDAVPQLLYFTLIEEASGNDRLWADVIHEEEGPLPKPPIPTLDHTLDRYIEYAEVVAEGRHQPLQRTQRAVYDFRKAGLVYQQRLLRLAETEENWINQFWLPEMYTALLIRGFVEYKNKIDTKQLEREVATGKLKTYMCMQQYDRILGCYRQPATDEDLHFLKPRRNTENEHILVMSRNQAFVVHTRVGGNLLPVADILFQLRQVLRMSEARKGLAVAVGAAGVGDRDRAARFWSAMQEVETNSISLTWARDALFVVCLDDEEAKSASAQNDDADSQSHEKNLIQQGKHILTGGGSRGHGLNRWYDATIQLIVSSSGTNGLCIEHSAAEGIVIIYMAESALRYERENRKRITVSLLTNELDLEVLIFNDFGRNFMKKSGFSPDGFVQLALQLAHYKSFRHSAAMTPHTGHSISERKCFQNLVGHGIDNHLCALLVLARQSVESGEIESLPDIFRDPLWTEVLRFPLSTSQSKMEQNEGVQQFCCGWYEAPLPKPPIPTLDHTLDRYIEYAEVVAEGRHQPLQRTQRAVQDFRKAGLVYQERLLRLAETEENWINQFWLPQAYLRFRTPLPVYTTPGYIFPHQHFEDEDDWLRFIYLFMRDVARHHKIQSYRWN